MKSNKGYVFFDEKRDGWYARITFADETGKRKDIKRKVENRTNGNKVLKTLIAAYDD